MTCDAKRRVLCMCEVFRGSVPREGWTREGPMKRGTLGGQLHSRWGYWGHGTGSKNDHGC